MANVPLVSSIAPAREDGFKADQVLTIAAGHFVHDTFTAFLNPLLPLIIDKLHLTLALAGSLSVYTRLPSLLNPFIGLLADRVDLRSFVILAPMVTAVAMSLIGLAPSYAVLALLLLATGLSSATLHVPGPVIVSRVSGRRVGTGMSFWMMAGELARMVGPLFAVAVVSWFTLEGYYPVMVLGMLTSLVLHFRFRGITIRPQAGATPARLGQTWRSLRRLMLPLAAIMLMRAFLRAALSVFLPTFVTAEGGSLWSGGTALAAVELAGAAGALAAGTLSDRAGRRLGLFVALLSAPCSMLLFLAVEGELLPLLLLASTGFAALSTTPVMMAMVQECGHDHPATANGIYMGTSFIIGAAAAPLVGWVGDLAGLHTAFTWSAILSLVAAPLVFLLPQEISRR